MDDALGVRRGEPVEHLAKDPQRLIGGQAAVAREERAQRLPLEQLHRQEHPRRRPAAVLEQLVHAADVAVRDASSELDLALEAGERLLARHEAGGDGLDGDVHGELTVARRPHLTHAPAAGAPQQLEAFAEDVAGLERAGDARDQRVVEPGMRGAVAIEQRLQLRPEAGVVAALLGNQALPIGRRCVGHDVIGRAEAAPPLSRQGWSPSVSPPARHAPSASRASRCGPRCSAPPRSPRTAGRRRP